MIFGPGLVAVMTRLDRLTYKSHSVGVGDSRGPAPAAI
jgi:hypothetical protein